MNSLMTIYLNLKDDDYMGIRCFGELIIDNLQCVFDQGFKVLYKRTHEELTFPLIKKRKGR